MGQTLSGINFKTLMSGLSMRYVTFLVLMAAFAARAQVGGGQGRLPSIPTDGGSTTQAADSGFQPWLSVNGTYTHYLDKTPSEVSYGGLQPGFAGGISGWKNWNQKKFEAGYTGSVNGVSNSNSGADWTQNHTVMLSYSQQVNQKASFGFTQVGGYTHGGYGYGSAYGITGVPGLSSSFGPGFAASGASNGDFGDVSNNGVVSGELLSTLSKFSLSSASVSYMLNQRWMVSGMGGVSFVRRSGQQYSQDSFQGGGGISYRLTRKSQIGGEYMQQNSRYSNLFGGVSSQSAMLNFQTQLSQTVTVSVGGGTGLIRSDFVGPVPIDPSLAELLGTTTVLQATQIRFLTPYYSASVSKQFERGSFSASAGRGSSAGNGVVMAGVQDTAIVTYSRTLNERIGTSWFGSYNRLSGRVATLAVTQTAQTGGMFSLRVFRSVSFTCQGGFRYQSIATSPRRRDLFAGFGLAWSPGDHPFIF